MTTFEQQSKKWKLVKAIGVGVMLLAAVLYILGSTTITSDSGGFVLGVSMAVLAGIGVLITAYGAVGSWWNHG